MMVPNTRTAGIALAFVTAAISGVSVFVNGYGAKHFADATVYTTSKNLVVAALLIALALGVSRSRASSAGRVPFTARDRWGFLAVGIIGGAVPFVLFFEGLQRWGFTDAGSSKRPSSYGSRCSRSRCSTSGSTPGTSPRSCC